MEIGGDFRVPDVMSNSGTAMVEVGSTNRTRLDDYKRAINDNTRLLMRVHPSNYRIIGFTDSPQLSELASLAHESGLPLYEDAGSGVLTDLSAFGITDEPIISESIRAGADVVSFSGDKLLGASQAGLIVGTARVDRSSAQAFALSRLESRQVLSRGTRGHACRPPPRSARRNTGAANAGHGSKGSGKKGKEVLWKVLKNSTETITASIVPGQSAVGGGSGPNVHPTTTLIALKHEQFTADQIEQKLRLSSPPVIARIADDLVLLDLEP